MGGGARPGPVASPFCLDERGAFLPLAALHRLQLHPADRLGGEVGRRPIVRAGEMLDAVREAEGFHRLVEVVHLVVIEVAVADRAEEGERIVFLRRRSEGEAGAGADDAGDRPWRGEGQDAGETHRAGVACGIDAGVVDGEAGMGVGPQRVHGGEVGRHRPIARRVPRAGHDPAIGLGGGPETTWPLRS